MGETPDLAGTATRAKRSADGVGRRAVRDEEKSAAATFHTVWDAIGEKCFWGTKNRFRGCRHGRMVPQLEGVPSNNDDEDVSLG